MCKRLLLISICVVRLLLIMQPQALGQNETMKEYRLINPATTVAIRQEGAKVMFQFSFSDDFGTEMRKNAPNDKVTHIVVLNSIGEEIWKLEAPYGGQGSSNVTYGVIPKGFLQLLPKRGKPPSLKIGETYYLRVAWPGGAGSFQYQESDRSGTR